MDRMPTQLPVIGVYVDSRVLTKKIINVIEVAKSQGTKTIDCDELIVFLNDIDHTKGDLSLADLESYKANNNQAMELFKSTITFGLGAIKSIFLLNAGAVVILLTFVTHLKRDDVTYFVSCIFPFAIGVMFAAILAFFAYITQFLYAYQDNTLRRFGYFFHMVCLVLAAISLYLFWEGITLTSAAFEVYGKTKSV